jgi:hypothetical protein
MLTIPDLRRALIPLAVAIAAFMSAIVVVLIPQPHPFLAQAPLACKVAHAQQSPETRGRDGTAVRTRSWSSNDLPKPSCA